jgi:hypothetical protein
MPHAVPPAERALSVIVVRDKKKVTVHVHGGPLDIST